jgi:hypothetical protein
MQPLKRKANMQPIEHKANLQPQTRSPKCATAKAQSERAMETHKVQWKTQSSTAKLNSQVQ